MFIDDCIQGTELIMHSDVTEPLNMGSSEWLLSPDLWIIAEEIAGIRGIPAPWEPMASRTLGRPYIRPEEPDQTHRYWNASNLSAHSDATAEPESRA